MRPQLPKLQLNHILFRFNRVYYQDTVLVKAMTLSCFILCLLPSNNFPSFITTFNNKTTFTIDGRD